MANPTTNYGFVLPTSSDLVTDLPADFDVALQGVDTRLKALQPGTTTGDVAYSSATANTNTRLAIGSTGDVLTVAGGVPSWAAPAGAPGANYSLLNSGGTALTGAATITVSGISGKDKILVLIIDASSTDAYGAMSVRLNADSGSNYAMSRVTHTYRTTNSVNDLSSSGALTNDAIQIGAIGDNISGVVNAGLTFTGCNGSGLKQFTSSGSGDAVSAAQFQQASFGQGFYSSASTISSVSVLVSPGTFDGSGRVYVYTSA